MRHPGAALADQLRDLGILRAPVIFQQRQQDARRAETERVLELVGISLPVANAHGPEHPLAVELGAIDDEANGLGYLRRNTRSHLIVNRYNRGHGDSDFFRSLAQ
jgi:hypothetical protein